jgi:hypothetical protein
LLPYCSKLSPGVFSLAVAENLQGKGQKSKPQPCLLIWMLIEQLLLGLTTVMLMLEE